MQQTHGFFYVACDPIGNDGLRFADGLLNRFAFGLFGWLEYIVDYRLLRCTAVARMINANAQSPKIGRAEFRLRVFQAVVTAGGTADFHFCRACGNVQFIVQHEDVFGQDFVKIGQCGNGSTRAIHIRHRFEQPNIGVGDACASGQAVKLRLRAQGCAVFTRDVIEQPPARVVPRVLVFRSVIAQSDDEFGGICHDGESLKSKQPTANGGLP